VALATLAIAAPSAADIRWFPGDLDQVLAVARSIRKPVLAEFFKPGCGVCAAQDSAFATPDVAGYAASTFLCVRLDLERAEGHAMARRFAVEKWPSLIFLDADGRETERLIGGRDAATLLAEMKRIRSGEGTVPDLLSHVDDYGGDAGFNFVLGSKLADRRDPRGTEFLERVMALDPANASGRSDDALLRLSRIARQDSNLALAASRLERLISAYPASEVVDGAYPELAGCYHDMGQAKRATAILERAVANRPLDPRAWNDLAWYCARWKTNLDRALEAARRATSLSHDDPLMLDTLAEVHFARGEWTPAVWAERRAVARRPGDRALQDQLAKFEAAAKAARGVK